MSRPLRALIVHPGSAFSTADVFSGLHYGLKRNGVEVMQFRMDGRIVSASSWMAYEYRKAKKKHPSIPKPTGEDKIYLASQGAVTHALTHQVDVAIIVSGFNFHPNAIVLFRRAGIKVVMLFTETPYNIEGELAMAALADGCWTNERSAVAQFKEVNPQSGYLPHAWHPERHRPDVRIADEDALPQHDVVFVGSGFAERAEFFNAIDWTGIDLGLYGTWKGVHLKPHVRAMVRGAQVQNAAAAALYRRAKVGLNLYRTSTGFSLKKGLVQIQHAESLSPRAYELAACGSFHLSEYRAEVPDVFGESVPTFSTPSEAEGLIRRWLADASGRARVSAALPAHVAESSWVHRAETVIGDVAALLKLTVAA